MSSCPASVSHSEDHRSSSPDNIPTGIKLRQIRLHGSIIHDNRTFLRNFQSGHRTGNDRIRRNSDSYHYHIGIEQLVCEQGVFVRKVDYMELYRIVDFQEHQSLMQQLCGLKTVRIFSTDRNTPRLDLTGMRRKDDIVPLIRGRVEYNKRKKGIYEITNH